MGKSLSEIVSSALNEADHQIKMASARDAVVRGNDFDFLASELDFGVKTAADENPPDAKDKDKKEPAKDKKDEEEKKASFLTNAAYGMKLAEALDTAYGVVTKIAADFTDAPGPTITESGLIGAKTIHPKAQTNSLSASEKSHGGGPLVTTPTGPNGMQTNEADYRDPDWTKNKEAAARYVNSKIAQANMLREMGQEEAARQIEASLKIAQDPSSPQPTLPAQSTSFMLSTEPGDASYIPDNSGLISMTRASARDASTREATQFFSEAPKQDNAVAANVGRTDGLKISSARGALLGAVQKTAGLRAVVENSPDLVEAYATKLASLVADESADPTRREEAALILATLEKQAGAMDALRRGLASPATKALRNAASTTGAVAPGRGGTISNLIGARQAYHVAPQQGRRLGVSAGRAAAPSVLGGIKTSAEKEAGATAALLQAAKKIGPVAPGRSGFAAARAAHIGNAAAPQVRRLGVSAGRVSNQAGGGLISTTSR